MIGTCNELMCATAEAAAVVVATATGTAKAGATTQQLAHKQIVRPGQVYN